MVQSLQIHGQHFELHPSGVLFWKEPAFLFVSDVHLGKVSHFRKYGAAVPREAIPGNFELLDACVERFNPKGIYFLGDLFHSYLNSEWRFFEAWAERINCNIVLVAGNHDIISPLKYEALGIRVVPEMVMEGFLFTHHPEEREGYFTVSGHVHPAIRLRGKGRQSLRLPCFFKTSSQLILPAFGSFTGMHTMEKKAGNEVYAIADRQVIKI
jgi:DNA ligase-associated metallophosphoesterase